MVSVPYIDELHRDTQPVVSSAHTSEKKRADVQLLSNDTHVDVLAFERESRAACHNVELLDLRQGVDDLFSHSVGKEFVFRVGAHADERKDCDGITCKICGWGGRWAGCRSVHRGYQSIAAF